MEKLQSCVSCVATGHVVPRSQGPEAVPSRSCATRCHAMEASPRSESSEDEEYWPKDVHSVSVGNVWKHQTLEM